MKNSNFTVQILEPDEGKFLTQVADVPNSERIFSTKVFLAQNDSIDNWKECDLEYKEQVESELTSEIQEEFPSETNESLEEIPE